MTATHGIAIPQSPARQRELRNLFVFSLLAHAALVGGFFLSPASRIQVPRGVVAVELVAMAAPQAPAPAAAPAPSRPAPPPPKPKPDKVVLPAAPTEPKPVAKPAPKPKPVPKVARPPAPPAPRDYEDVLAELRAASGETAPVAPKAAPRATAAVGPVGRPDGVVITPEVAAWLKRAKIHVRKNWVVPPGFRTQALMAHVEVELDAGGNVKGTPEITRRSGNPWYDEGVVRAIQKSSPLPPPPEAGRWPFVFVPEDSY